MMFAAWDCQAMSISVKHSFIYSSDVHRKLEADNKGQASFKNDIYDKRL